MKTIIIVTFVLTFFIVICSASRGDFEVDEVGNPVDQPGEFKDDLEDPSADRKITVLCTRDHQASNCKTKLKELKINDQQVFKTVISPYLHHREVTAFFTGKCSKYTEITRSVNECNAKDCATIKCT